MHRHEQLAEQNQEMRHCVLTSSASAFSLYRGTMGCGSLLEDIICPGFEISTLTYALGNSPG